MIRKPPTLEHKADTDPTDAPDARGWVVDLHPGGERFTADPSIDVLSSARRAGLRLPSSCRNGTCRACRARCLAGDVEYRVEWPGLSAEERADGWILPCVAQPRSDLVIDIRPLATSR